ncbi:MAG: hypothetical protein ABUL60_06450 [Myxococcales bacterium]
MKLRWAKIAWVLVPVSWAACSSSPHEFSDARGGSGGLGESAGSSATGKGGSNDSGEAGAGTMSGGSASGAPEQIGGEPAGGSDEMGGSAAAGAATAGAAGSGGSAGSGSGGSAGSGGTAGCGNNQDFTGDAKNCGRCGHDCGALSSCVNSRCQAAPIITELTYAQGMDVSAKGVFFTAGNTIQSCTKPAMCAASQQQIGSPSSASTLGVTKTLAQDLVAYYGRAAAPDKYPGYHSCPITGCGSVPLASGGPSGAVSGLIGVDAELYYQSSGNVSDPSTSSVVRLSGNADGTQGTKLTIGDRAVGGRRIAVDSQYVYYVRIDTNNESNVVACSRTTGCGNTYASLGTGDPTNFAAYGGKLYWLNGIQLKRCDATDASSVASVATLSIAPDKDMLIDGNAIYWQTSNSVVYCALPSCVGGVKTLASGLAAPSVLRMDANFIYWLIPSDAGSATGGVYRVAKP